MLLKNKAGLRPLHPKPDMRACLEEDPVSVGLEVGDVVSGGPRLGQDAYAVVLPDEAVLLPLDHQVRHPDAKFAVQDSLAQLQVEFLDLIPHLAVTHANNVTCTTRMAIIGQEPLVAEGVDFAIQSQVAMMRALFVALQVSCKQVCVL